MMPVLIAKLIKTKFAKLYSHFASVACIALSNHSASVAHIFGNAEYLSSYQIIVPQLQVFLATQSNCDHIKSLRFGCTYFWQLKVIELLLNHCASFALFLETRSHWALIKPLWFSCMYYLQGEVNELLSNHCALVALIFCNTKSLSSLSFQRASVTRIFLVIRSHWDH